MDKIAPDQPAFGALLSPQGKILYDFFIHQAGEESFLIDVPRDLVGDLIRRLMMYRLRAKVDVTDVSQEIGVLALWGDEAAALRAQGATPEQLTAALDFQQKAQWRLDFIAAENSMGFHAPQEAARILGEAADYARQGQIAALTARGVRLKIITGDNLAVARHVADAVQLPIEGTLTGGGLDALDDEALWHLAERTTLFAEVEPNQKERIILALRKTGHVVGYMGDGINDAPALHAADVGISVDTAVDVAREAADFVLLRKDLMGELERYLSDLLSRPLSSLSS
jgi:hypothetical protein